MIKIYSKEECKYCRMAKEFLKENSIPFEEVKMDPESPEYPTQRDELIEKTNHRTFPFVFVGESFVGGYTDLVHAFNTQKLHALLLQQGVQIEEPDF